MQNARAEHLVELCRRYREPTRHYHTLEHVAEMLGWLEILRGHAERPALVAWAIWFHDAVYDPTRRDNEAQSAALAGRMLPPLGLTTSDCERVCELVMGTAQHHAQEADGDLALFLDLDLAILGMPEERYEAYTQQVRAEYAFVPPATFCAKRADLVAAWLHRPQLYFTEVGRTLFERPARENLARELHVLEKGT